MLLTCFYLFILIGINACNLYNRHIRGPRTNEIEVELTPIDKLIPEQYHTH